MLAPAERINPKLESTCAVGVDEMSWDDLNSAHYDWPKGVPCFFFCNFVQYCCCLYILVVIGTLTVLRTFLMLWHAVTVVTEYRKQVRELMDRIIRQTPFTMPIDWDSPMWPILMVCKQCDGAFSFFHRRVLEPSPEYYP